MQFGDSFSQLVGIDAELLRDRAASFRIYLVLETENASTKYGAYRPFIYLERKCHIYQACVTRKSDAFLL
jgi:hypothetical protein